MEEGREHKKLVLQPHQPSPNAVNIFFHSYSLKPLGTWVHSLGLRSPKTLGRCVLLNCLDPADDPANQTNAPTGGIVARLPMGVTNSSPLSWRSVPQKEFTSGTENMIF